MTEILGTKRLKSLFSESAWIILGQILVVLGSLLGIKLLTKFLEPNVYGELMLAVTVSALVVQIVTGPLSNGITQYYAPAKESGKLQQYLKSANNLTIYGSILVLVLMFLSIIYCLILRKFELIALIIVAFVFSIINGNNFILCGIQNAARQRVIVAIHQGLEPWMRYLVASGMILLFGSTSLVALIGYTIGISLVYISQYKFFKKYIANPGSSSSESSIKKSTNFQKEIIDFSWPFAAWGLFTWAQQVSDRWALEFYNSTKEVGLFAVLYQLGYYPISLMSGMAVQLLAPIFYQQAGDARDDQRNMKVEKQTWWLTLFILGLTLFAFIIVYFIHNWIFHIFVSIQYSSVSKYLPWLVLSGGIFAAGQTLTINIQSKMKTRLLLFPKIASATIGIIMNFIFAYYYGIPGIIIASNLFSVIYFIWLGILTIRIKRLSVI